jgi:hypothetical protein
MPHICMASMWVLSALLSCGARHAREVVQQRRARGAVAARSTAATARLQRAAEQNDAEQ